MSIFCEDSYVCLASALQLTLAVCLNNATGNKNLIFMMKYTFIGILHDMDSENSFD